MILVLRGVILTGCVGLSLFIFLAFQQSSIEDSFARITEDYWGWVTLIDLYLGFFLIAVVIAFVEKKLLAAVFWILPLFFLGNVWSALWLIIRLPTIASHFIKK